MASEAEHIVQSEMEEAGLQSTHDIVQPEREEAGVESTENEKVGEGEHEEVEDDSESYKLLGSTADDQDKQSDYEEYKRLVKDQNNIIECIKGQIHDINCKPCPTRCEQNDLMGLYKCLEQERVKLRDLTEKAMCLQNFQIQTSRAASIKRQPGSCWIESCSETSELDKSGSCQDTTDMDGQTCESEEIKLMREILTAFKASGSSGHKKFCQKQIQKTYTCEEKESMEKIRNKVNCMQQRMNQLKEEFCKVEKMISAICSQQQKTSYPQPPLPKINPALLCLGKKSPKAELFQKLNDNYLYLLTELSKKDEQLQELSKNLKTTCGSCGTSGRATIIDGNANASELHLLRNRVNEMKEEQVEFKCLMREQSLQLEDYRNKYLTAQQKVEEQCALLEKLNMNNKRIEKQINLEVKEIRAKFQEKLNELLQFPKLLENEQIRLAQTCKEKDVLESKLVIVCKELKSLKSKMNNSNNDEDCKPQLQRCQQELCQVKKNMEEIQRQRDMFCEQLRTTVEDLDTLRSESAKIIARTKERAEHVKQHQQEQIDRLEKQLAQCRATACLSVSDRETVIREMQGQLNTLSYSFDAAQRQIKTLRNHITYMSNENCFPANC